jgi:hypothetical protein
MSEERTCPSSRCEPGATLLGVVNSDGTVGYVTTPLTIDEDFVATANEGRTPERRFRFAGPCVEGRCQQWTGSRCGVIDKVLDMPTDNLPDAAGLPKCSVRTTCRWYAQSGAAACRVCPYVITDLREEGVPLPQAG